MAPVLLNTDS